MKRLTPKESQVVEELMIDGASNKLIAQRLGSSERTIKTHMKSVLLKLQMPPGLHNRTAVVLYFQKHPDLLIPSAFGECSPEL